MTVYHCTTPKKLARYVATGAILPPVRFWLYRNSAEAWAEKTRRSIILAINPRARYPLPDHKPSGHAWWSDDPVREWEVVKS